MVAPVSAPSSRPEMSAAGTAAQLRPGESEVIIATTAVTPRMEPTARSIPPVRMTKVMPVARTMLMESLPDDVHQIIGRQEVRCEKGEQHADQDQDGQDADGLPETAETPRGGEGLRGGGRGGGDGRGGRFTAALGERRDGWHGGGEILGNQEEAAAGAPVASAMIFSCVIASAPGPPRSSPVSRPLAHDEHAVADANDLR